MCLTIPAKVVKLRGRRAVVSADNKIREIDVGLVSELKVGDWVLSASNFAVKKISQEDASEIIYLLASSKSVNISKLSRRFRNVINEARARDLTKNEIVYLLNAEGEEKEALFSEANVVRKTYLKDFICVHGIIEFSNFCRQDCAYCGLRRDNRKLRRYRMSADEIVDASVRAVREKGYKLLVLQSGEDYFYTNDVLEDIIKQIKRKVRVFIFISIGERGYECYKKLKEAGVSGVLLRFETSNPELFKKLHPHGKDFKNRFEHLKLFKKLGYFVATGSLIGLPGQTVADLADDILTVKKYANMVSMGPFVPCEGTPLFHSSHGSAEVSLKMIAISRLMMPRVRIPSVTSLETLAPRDGRMRALQSGANSIMLNLTPSKYRSLYKIYPGREYKRNDLLEKYGLFKYEKSYRMLEERMRKELKVN